MHLIMFISIITFIIFIFLFLISYLINKEVGYAFCTAMCVVSGLLMLFGLLPSLISINYKHKYYLEDSNRQIESIKTIEYTNSEYIVITELGNVYHIEIANEVKDITRAV